MGIFNEIIKKIGEELGIKVTLLSCDWLTVLEKDNQIHYIQGYKFELNNHGIGNIMDDKGLFYDLAVYKKLPIIEHFVIFKDYDKEEVLNYFLNHDNKLVIKGNMGTSGEEVFKVNNQIDLFNIIDILLQSQFSISLCPFYDIKNEYRVIVFNGKPRVIYGKMKPMVIGDGIKNLYELAIEYNEIYKKRQELLENPDYIPKLNEEVELNFQFNLSRGAKMFTDIPADFKKELMDLAIKVTTMLNITFASVDIIKTKDNKLLIMEANSGVMMDNFIRFNGALGYSKAYNLYKDAIKLMFNMK